MFLRLIALLFVLAFAGAANATGMHQPIFNCQSLVNGPGYKLTNYSTSPPGGPVSEWYEFELQAVDASQNKRIRLDLAETVADGNSKLMQFNSVDPNSFGVFQVLFLGNDIFVAASIQYTVGTDLSFVTPGLVKINGDGMACAR